MCLMTGLTTYSKTLCQFIEIVSRCVGDGGPRKKKLSMQGVRGQAILLCEFIRLDFFRDWVFEEGAYLFIKNKFRHTFYYRNDPTPSILKHTY